MWGARIDNARGVRASYDSSLKLDILENLRLVCYANDIVAIIIDKRMTDCPRFQASTEKNRSGRLD